MVDGIVTDFSPIQMLNADSPIVIMPSAKLIFCKALQPEKLLLPQEVMVEGMVISLNRVQPSNILSPIQIRPSGRVTFERFVQP